MLSRWALPLTDVGTALVDFKVQLRVRRFEKESLTFKNFQNVVKTGGVKKKKTSKSFIRSGLSVAQSVALSGSPILVMGSGWSDGRVGIPRDSTPSAQAASMCAAQRRLRACARAHCAT